MEKKILSVPVLLSFCFFINSQETKVKNIEGYEFTTVRELKITPIKNQNRSGTCWSFSGIALIESELLRTGRGEYDLSEMFVVNHSYKDKAGKYVRTHGYLNYAQGGSFYDVLYVLKNYGAMPGELYRGLEYGEKVHVHAELENASLGFLKGIVEKKNGKLSTAWKKAFDGIIDAYLGEIPVTFNYKGEEYTPESYGRSLGLDFDDYISLTSYTHQPFYSQFSIEIPDNWRWAGLYNIPLDELMQVLDNAVNTGYTVAWGSDVSEKGFIRNGLAVMPDIEYEETKGSDQEHWVGISRTERDRKIDKLVENPSKQIDVTQEMRQLAYDNYESTDDHGMLIFGTAKDQNGNKYYMVKNSWGTDNMSKGIWYASESFVAYKTINIVVHKDAIPKALKSKLDIK